jgi:molybdate transport system ATP-binding protein
MDEPFSALDPEMRTTIITELKTLLTELRTTCLIVSHNPLEIDTIADAELRIG